MSTNIKLLTIACCATLVCSQYPYYFNLGPYNYNFSRDRVHYRDHQIPYAKKYDEQPTLTTRSSFNVGNDRNAFSTARSPHGIQNIAQSITQNKFGTTSNTRNEPKPTGHINSNNRNTDSISFDDYEIYTTKPNKHKVQGPVVQQAVKPSYHQGLNSDVTSVSNAVTNFGFNLLKTIGPTVTNVVVSPYSIATLLALMQQATGGFTQDEISIALGLSPNDAINGFKTITNYVKTRVSPHVVLDAANKVYISDSFQLNPNFKRVSKINFNSDIDVLKFSRPLEAVATINDWVALQTHQKIRNLLSTDALNANTQAVLVNAVYFKGLWKSKFDDADNIEGEFHRGNGIIKRITYMATNQALINGWDSVNKVQTVVLPFEGEHQTLVVILPDQGTSIDSVITTLTMNDLKQYHKYTAVDVDLELPKFMIKTDTDLAPVLTQMGLRRMFLNGANFTGLASHGAPQISTAVHSAVFSIDENGGTAAAATAFGAVALSNSDTTVVFKANRPFLAVLWDQDLSLPLFVARIEDPQV